MEITIVKPNGEKLEKFGKVEDGIITQLGKPIFSKVLCEKYGLLDKAKKVTSLRGLTTELKKCCFRPGTMEDGTIVTVRDPEAERKAEKTKQNAFLKQHGYTWGKESVYVDSYTASINPHLAKYDGDFAEEWVLRGPDGNEITQPIDDLLIDLGYFGEQGKIDREVKRVKEAEAAQIRKEAKEAKEKILAWFEAEFPKSEKPGDFVEVPGEEFHFPADGFNIYGGGYGFVIQSDGLWKIQNNGADGDMWSLNNYKTGGAGAIARWYPYDEKIANMIRQYCEKGLF